MPRSTWPHLAALALILAETCWLTPWFRMVQPGREGISLALAFVVLVAGMLSAYLWSAFCEALALLPAVKRGGGLLFFTVSLALAARLLLGFSVNRLAGGLLVLLPALVLLLMTWLWVWARGSLLGSEALRPITAWRRFSLGLMLFIANAFIATRLAADLRIDPPGLALFAWFLFFSLVGMVLARIAFVSLSHGVRKNPFDRRWLAGVLATAAGLVTLAVVLGSLLSGQYRLLLDQAAVVVSWTVVVIFYLASLPWLALTYLIGPLGRLLDAVLPVRAVATPGPEEAYPLPPGAITLPDQPIAPVSPVVQALIFWGIVLLIIAGLFLGRARRRRLPVENEQADWLLAPGTGWRQVQRGLREQLNQAGGLFGALRSTARPAQRVRQIYADWLELCARLRWPRQVGQTPQEFLAEAGQFLPERAVDLALLTAAYQRVRYGELPEAGEELDAIEAAWRRIQSDARHVKRARQGEIQTADLDKIRRTVQ